MRTLASLFLIGMMSAAFADEIRMKNGDRLTGKVTGLAGGRLRLASGRWLEGKIGPSAVDGAFSVESAGAAAPAEVAFTQTASIIESPAAWRGRLTVAGKATDGNTDNRSLLVSGEVTRETDKDLLLGKAIYHNGKSGGALSERNAYGMAKYQHRFYPTMYGYLSEELLSDRFKDLKLNTVSSVGAGTDVMREERIDLSLEAGIAYITNNYHAARDESHVGGRAAASLRLALPLGLELKDAFTIYPNFEDWQDYQLRNEATLGTALGSGWDLHGGVITEYDRTPSPGVKARDDTYFIGLGYVF